MSPIRFHDCHAHAIDSQQGGFVIALEGKPALEFMIPNERIASYNDPSRLRFAVPYVSRSGIGFEGPLAKYHARREKYSPEWVAADIERFSRKVVLVDSLNSIDWPPAFYRDLALKFPAVQFVMCHAGGYDILEFVKMARFMKNVWIDFSLTQEIFGWFGKHPRLSVVADCIDHAYTEPALANKVMFGSDNPEFIQHEVANIIAERVPGPERFLINNFERLVDVGGLV